MERKGLSIVSARSSKSVESARAPRVRSDRSPCGEVAGTMDKAERKAAMPAEGELGVTAADGWPLSIEHRRAVGPERGVVLLGHAMMANRRSLDRPRGRGLASTLRAAGLATYALDVRGHGKSGPGAGEGGDWSYDDVVLQDLPAAIGFVRERHPAAPLAVLGHSLVGHATLALLGQRPELCSAVDAVVSVAANVWIPQDEPSGAYRLGKWLFLAGMGLAAWPLGRFPARALGIGSDDEAPSYVEQFQVLRSSGRWLSLDGWTDYLEGLHRVRVPVLAVVGRGDRLLCRPECSRRFHRHLTGARVWHWTAGRGAHGLLYDPDHMQIVTDARSAPVWEEVAGWLIERFERRGEPLEPGFVED
jgi:predicted alpha/beta hydrolase